MNKRLLISLPLVLLILTACAGAPQTTVIGKDETTAVLLMGDLVGGTVELSNGFSRTIEEDDLQKSLTNLPSIKNSADQDLDYVLLNVDPGEMELSFTTRDGRFIKQRIYVAPGVTNQVRVD